MSLLTVSRLHVQPKLQTTSNMETTDLKPTGFSCHAPDAQAVFVTGSFNDWNPATLLLDRQVDGHWRNVVPLSAGDYEFRFIVDGQWSCEPGLDDQAECPGSCGNDHDAKSRHRGLT